jgi:hypothetical protein
VSRSRTPDLSLPTSLPLTLPLADMSSLLSSSPDVALPRTPGICLS